MLPDHASENELDLRLIDVRTQLFLITDEQPSLGANPWDKEFSKCCFRCLIDDGEIEWNAFCFKLASSRNPDRRGTYQIDIVFEHMSYDVLPLLSIFISPFGG